MTPPTFDWYEAPGGLRRYGAELWSNRYRYGLDLHFWKWTVTILKEKNGSG